MSIFRHTDRDGDELEVHVIGEDDRDYPGTLMFGNTGRLDDTGTMISSSLDRDAALRLHAALGEWLYPVHTPEWANKSLIEQMIEKAVKDQVAAVLPLHLKPVATLKTPGDRGEYGYCWGVPGCPHRCHFRYGSECADKLPEGDPEPHDVGHAEEPVIRTHSLMCPRMTHVDAPCTCVPDEPTDHGRLMSELPVRTRPRPICVSCGHGWGEHTSGVCWGTAQTPEGVGCTCTRERPGTTGTS